MVINQSSYENVNFLFMIVFNILVKFQLIFVRFSNLHLLRVSDISLQHAPKAGRSLEFVLTVGFS